MKNDKDNREILKALSLLAQLGLTMASCIIVGILIGKFLDHVLNTSPWLLVVFAFLGAIAAFKTLYDIVIKEWR